MDNTQDEHSRLSSFRGTRSPDYSLSPAAATGLRSSPRSKRMTRLRLAYSASRAVSVGMPRFTLVGNPDARPSRVAPQAFSFESQQSLCMASAYCAAIGGCRLSTRPQRRRRRWPDQRSELLTIAWTPAA